MSSATALLIAQSLLSQWFLYYEVPGVGLDQLLPILTSQVTILTPSQTSPLTGIAQAIEAADRRGPLNGEYQNSHEIRSIQVVEVGATQITASAQVIYQLEQGVAIVRKVSLTYDLSFEMEGDRFRISRLFATLNADQTIPADACAPSLCVTKNLLIKAQANAALARASLTPSDLRNDIEAFVSRWYRFFDLRPDGIQLETMLAPNPIDISMYQRFTSQEAYLSWYAQMRQTPMLNAHHVQRVDLRSIEEKRVVADLYLIWQNEREGQLQTLPMRNVATLIRAEDGSWRMQAYEPGRLPF